MSILPKSEFTWRPRAEIEWQGNTYAIQQFDIASEFQERTPFLKSMEGELQADVRPLEELVLDRYRVYRVSVSPLLAELEQLAATYKMFADKRARLPKFSRWVMGMWKDRTDLSNLMADIGREASGHSPLVMSCKAQDILRSGDTPHFISCFSSGGTWGYMPRLICKYAPGIALIYQDDDKGKIMGRVWVHHAKDVDSGEDIVVLGGFYGSLYAKRVISFFKQKSIKVCTTARSVSRTTKRRVNYHQAFEQAVHHDVSTHIPNTLVYE